MAIVLNERLVIVVTGVSFFFFLFQKNRGAAERQVTNIIKACATEFNIDVRYSVQVIKRC